MKKGVVDRGKFNPESGAFLRSRAQCAGLCLIQRPGDRRQPEKQHQYSANHGLVRAIAKEGGNDDEKSSDPLGIP